MLHAIGTEHQIPSGPKKSDKKEATGIRTTHSDSKVINIGTSVSPAPLITPVKMNMTEKMTQKGQTINK